ncbi:RluA family pseudouridine synthase [Bythopirellula goksoeyrii]|uniref:Ribosomal large subunit pseudouridine synthase D n=1 Tax=Bythopirellula goksoeyrii TaxID=1400387 RepID=A0A5B9QAA4_9BACT|nr:RluA family pseudouridine synthase [Bythopirellula goksoeyrii]QEG34679.1 Ribosomal large subunit pseudouridine synthase D [Bythopirellula goksoeyrii]
MNDSLEILYEDGPCLVVNKAAGVLTQAPRGIDSMEVRVKDYYRRQEQKPADANIYLGITHRMDRPTTGALIFARHVRAAQRICAQFADRTVNKIYWAFVEGHVTPDEDTWTDYLHKRHGIPKPEIVTADHPAAKHAILHYRVLWQNDWGTWLEIELETGRTHQIRVQAASRGYPVVGDVDYGSQRPFGPPKEEPRERPIALHARQISFRHPMKDESVSVVAPLSQDWDALELPQELQ